MKDASYMQIAYLVAQESKCVSWAVGALIVKNGRIIATGYNGSPSGHKNCCDHAQEMGWVSGVGSELRLLKAHREDHSKWSDKHETHAEINAISFAARHGVAIDGATMYVTLSPCMHCSKQLAQTGINRVVYGELYDRNTDDWNKTLLDSNIQVELCDINTPEVLINMQKIRTFRGE